MASVARARRIVVLGAGPAGLAAAYAARAAASAATEIVVLEADARVGGWLHSAREDDFLFERGCRGIRPQGSGAAVLALVEELGLAEHALAASASAAVRYVWHGGRLEKLPTSLWEAARSPLTRDAPSWLARDVTAGGRAKARGVHAPAMRTCPGDDDGYASTTAGEEESVSAFAGRRLSPFVGDVLLDAAFSGVYAGDITTLSARAVMGSAWRAEAAGGSITAGVLRGQLEALRRPAAVEEASPFLRAARACSSVSFREGVGTLPAALEAALVLPGRSGRAAIRVERGARVTALQYDGEGERVRVHVGARVLAADAVISALPAPALAAAVNAGLALGSQSGGDKWSTVRRTGERQLAAAVGAIPYASVGIVCMGWRHGAGGGSAPSPVLPVDGFGYLVPSGARGAAVQPGQGQELLRSAEAWALTQGGGAPPTVPVLGCIFDSAVFPGQAALARDLELAGVQSSTEPRGGVRLPSRGQDALVSVRQAETRVTVMLGGATWPEAAALGQDDLAAIGRAALAVHTRSLRGATAAKLPPPPDTLTARVAAAAIPQYNVGHTGRVRDAEAGAATAFGSRLLLAGNAFRGVGVADAVANGLAAGRLAVERVSGRAIVL